ncbi:hypothetical protein [uncultured Imperialibacter sp.]|uniref:hypothetical protein n=1 Tax=uncultured Imperialibacter sp. TaxID=1672639 RepID=UPI0030DBF638
MKALVHTRKNQLAHSLFLTIASTITLMLFYIDEGRYSFEGLLSLEFLPAFLFYGTIFFGLQAAPFHLTERILGFSGRLITSFSFFLSLLVADYWAIS